MWWIYLGVFGYWNPSTLTTRISNYYLIVFEYSLNDAKNHFYAFPNTVAKMMNIFNNGWKNPCGGLFIGIFELENSARTR